MVYESNNVCLRPKRPTVVRDARRKSLRSVRIFTPLSDEYLNNKGPKLRALFCGTPNVDLSAAVPPSHIPSYFKF